MSRTSILRKISKQKGSKITTLLNFHVNFMVLMSLYGNVLCYFVSHIAFVLMPLWDAAVDMPRYCFAPVFYCQLNLIFLTRFMSRNNPSCKPYVWFCIDHMFGSAVI